LDGANVEILDAVGDDNAYIFGATEEQLPSLKRDYDPRWHYENVPGLKRVIDTLTDGTLDDNGSGWFHDLRQSLMEPGWPTRIVVPLEGRQLLLSGTKNVGVVVTNRVEDLDGSLIR
jgi:glucan phosphorylase